MCHHSEAEGHWTHGGSSIRTLLRPRSHTSHTRGVSTGSGRAGSAHRQLTARSVLLLKWTGSLKYASLNASDASGCLAPALGAVGGDAKGHPSSPTAAPGLLSLRLLHHCTWRRNRRWVRTHGGLVPIVGGCCLLGGALTSIPPTSQPEHHPHCRELSLAHAATGTWATQVSAGKSSGTTPCPQGTRQPHPHTPAPPVCTDNTTPPRLASNWRHPSSPPPPHGVRRFGPRDFKETTKPRGAEGP